MLAAALLGGGLWHRRQRAASRYEPPAFTEPGPRAPSSELLGVRVGVAHLTDVRRKMESWGVACGDRSMRTLMGEIRERKREELRRAEEHGQADAVTGASIVSRRTARDDNPQIRLSCDRVASARLLDRTRAGSEGRALFVFDTDAAPVRHASFERNLTGWAEAWADFASTRAALSARFGAPTDQQTGASGAPAPEPPEPLPKYARRVAEWRFADLTARVSITNLGGRGFSIEEVAEVPWPVRADAASR